MAKITKLELDKKLKEWQEQAITKGQNLQKGLGGGLILVILKNTGKADFFSRKPFQRLGSVNKMSLANAYKKAEELKAKEQQTTAPRRKKDKTPKLKDYFLPWLEEKAKNFKPSSTRPQNLKALYKNTLYPLHELSLSDIKPKAVYERLSAIEQTGNNKHNAVTLLADILKTACLQGVIEYNPMQGINPFKCAKAQGYKSVSYTELRQAFFEPLKITPMANRVFYLLIALVGFRFGECRLLHWSWIDFTKEIIIIPPDALGANKTQTEYKKPMSKETVKLLMKWRALCEPASSDFVFATQDKRFSGAMCESVFREPVKALTDGRQDFHGFRKCIKTFLIDHGFSAYDSELVLSHDIRNSLEKTYDKGDRIENARACAQAWADYLIKNQITPEFLELIN